MEKSFSFNTKYVNANPQKCRVCFGCRCIKICADNVIGKVGASRNKHIAFINPDNCSGCMKCVTMCRTGVFVKREII